jgi:hypothetical protein
MKLKLRFGFLAKVCCLFSFFLAGLVKVTFERFLALKSFSFSEEEDFFLRLLLLRRWLSVFVR